jgi:hypothetical protein
LCLRGEKVVEVKTLIIFGVLGALVVKSSGSGSKTLTFLLFFMSWCLCELSVSAVKN